MHVRTYGWHYDYPLHTYLKWVVFTSMWQRDILKEDGHTDDHILHLSSLPNDLLLILFLPYPILSFLIPPLPSLLLLLSLASPFSPLLSLLLTRARRGDWILEQRVSVCRSGTSRARTVHQYIRYVRVWVQPVWMLYFFVHCRSCVSLLHFMICQLRLEWLRFPLFDFFNSWIFNFSNVLPKWLRRENSTLRGNKNLDRWFSPNEKSRISHFDWFDFFLFWVGDSRIFEFFSGFSWIFEKKSQITKIATTLLPCNIRLFNILCSVF